MSKKRATIMLGMILVLIGTMMVITSLPAQAQLNPLLGAGGIGTCALPPLPVDPPPSATSTEIIIDPTGSEVVEITPFRMDCDGGRSVVLLRVVPILDDANAGIEFEWSEIIQNNNEFNGSSLVSFSDPQIGGGRQVSVVLPTTVAVIPSSYATQNSWPQLVSPSFDYNASFQLFYGNQGGQSITVPALDDDSQGPAFINIGDLSGLWFDANFAGSGLNILSNSDIGLLLTDFTYTADGQQLWLISETLPIEQVIPGQSITVDLLVGENGNFQSPQNPGTDPLRVWGTVTLTFNDCASGTAVLDGEDGVIEYQLVQLVGSSGTQCTVQ